MPDEMHIIDNLAPEVVEMLLTDHSRKPRYCGNLSPHTHIIWATNDYSSFGTDYSFHQPIMASWLCVDGEYVVRSRVAKSREVQHNRSREKAEVFTPSWVCNAQNNLVDEAWFGRKGAFNTELPDHSWIVNEEPISMPEGKRWQQYVGAVRMEMSCGEAPYLTSRYDAATGQPIPIGERIGLLDRKLRLVGEHCGSTGQWLRYAYKALQSLYAFEWQGDSLLIARTNLLQSFIEAYSVKFGHAPLPRSIRFAAYIISWNVVQMDGLKFVVPCSCLTRHRGLQLGLFSKPPRKLIACEGCATGNPTAHNGIPTLIRDWRLPRDKQVVPFFTLLTPHSIS